MNLLRLTVYIGQSLLEVYQLVPIKIVIKWRPLEKRCWNKPVSQGLENEIWNCASSGMDGGGSGRVMPICHFFYFVKQGTANSLQPSQTLFQNCIYDHYWITDNIINLTNDRFNKMFTIWQLILKPRQGLQNKIRRHFDYVWSHIDFTFPMSSRESRPCPWSLYLGWSTI